MNNEISKKLEELILKALEKMSIEQAQIFIDMRLSIARIRSMEGN